MEVVNKDRAGIFYQFHPQHTCLSIDTCFDGIGKWPLNQAQNPLCYGVAAIMRSCMVIWMTQNLKYVDSEQSTGNLIHVLNQRPKTNMRAMTYVSNISKLCH